MKAFKIYEQAMLWMGGLTLAALMALLAVRLVS